MGNSPGPGVNRQAPGTLPTLCTHKLNDNKLKHWPALSPRRSCNKTGQIQRLGSAGRGQNRFEVVIEAARIWSLKEERLAEVQHHAGSCGVAPGVSAIAVFGLRGQEAD